MESGPHSGDVLAPPTDAHGQRLTARQAYLPVDRGQLFYREIGQGQPIIVLHGGPAFDHTYLLPELDRLAEAARLIYYDQRGRGKSRDNVQAAEVSLASDVADIESLREHFRLGPVTLLGHSWGGLLALECATHFPERVSHLILMNTAPVSYQDWTLFDKELRARRAEGEHEAMETLAASASFKEGDPDTRADYFRLHFRPAFARSDQLERLVARLRASFAQTDVLLVRQIAERLFAETAESSDYDLFPQLSRLRIPTLVIQGDHDFIPVECAVHIAGAIAGARLVLLEDCGHFAAMESPESVREAISAFLE